MGIFSISLATLKKPDICVLSFLPMMVEVLIFCNPSFIPNITLHMYSMLGNGQQVHVAECLGCFLSASGW